MNKREKRLKRSNKSRQTHCDNNSEASLAKTPLLVETTSVSEPRTVQVSAFRLQQRSLSSLWQLRIFRNVEAPCIVPLTLENSVPKYFFSKHLGGTTKL